MIKIILLKLKTKYSNYRNGKKYLSQIKIRK